MAFLNASRCGETGGGCVGSCGQTGTGRTLTVRRGETVAVDSDGGDGMHGRYDGMNVRLEDVGSKGGQKRWTKTVPLGVGNIGNSGLAFSTDREALDSYGGNGFNHFAKDFCKRHLSLSVGGLGLACNGIHF